MKILQLLPELNEGGVERGVVELNREFVAHGIESYVVSNGGRFVEQIHQDGGTHIQLDVCSKNPFSAPRRMLALRKTMREISPDIVHARSRVPAWLTYLANKKLHIPFVTTVHGMNSVNAYSQIMTRGDRVICVSEVIEHYIKKNYAVAAGKITVIQRGVDMKVFNPENTSRAFMQQFKQQYGLADRFVVTSVGRITYLKDYETFIKAMARCRHDIPNIVGLIVGGVREDKQDYLEGLKALVRDLQLEDAIVFAGNQSEMPEIYQLSDIVVNASLKMGNVGRTVVEALAMNTPVLATTFEGLANLVEDGRNGYIVTNQNPDGLSKRIQQLYQQPITETRQSIKPEFTLDAMVQATLTVYQSLRDAGSTQGSAS